MENEVWGGSTRMLAASQESVDRKPASLSALALWVSWGLGDGGGGSHWPSQFGTQHPPCRACNRGDRIGGAAGSEPLFVLLAECGP